jgi:hypothetical protein
MRERGDIVIRRAGVGGGSAHNLIGLPELAADLLDRDRQFRRSRRGGFHIQRRLVRAVHGAFGALQRMIGRRQQ